jgi:glycosyltransferase involved in cell wall biosynthesis
MTFGANRRPSILFIVPADYDSLVQKGVEHMVLDRDEGGYFEKVITLHPFCAKTRMIRLNARHEVHEIGFDWLPGTGKMIKYAQLPVHFVRVIWAAFRLAKANAVDLIRANDPYWTGLFGAIAARLCGLPLCVSIHADYAKRTELDQSISISSVFGSHRLTSLLERLVLSTADMVMPIRDSLATHAAARGARPDRIRVIPHGIDLSAFDARPITDIRARFAIARDVRIVSFVGRFSRDNYIHEVLDVARKLGEKRTDFVLVMAGGGKEDAPVRAHVEQDPLLRARTLIVGFQPRQVCLDLRRASAASLCLMGGFSLIEACAAGTPVISYDVEWHSELVKDRQTGLLLREHDIDGVTDGLAWLLDHPIECAEMGQAAKILAFQRHDLARTSAIKVRWYSELLSGTSLS